MDDHATDRKERRQRGRPPVKSTQSVDVSTPTGVVVPVKIEMPVSSDAVVTRLEVKTRAELERPETSDENKARFNEAFFRSQNYFPSVPWVVDSKRIQASYILKYVGYPQKVLVTGCATGHELTAYNDAGIRCVGQEMNADAVRLAHPSVAEQIRLCEWYNLLDQDPEIDTVQFIETLQYMQGDVYDATLFHLRKNTQIKHVIVSITNYGYEHQINSRAQQATFDVAMADVFDKLNDVDDYMMRYELLGAYKNQGCYGIFPTRLVYIYKRKSA